ncbi:hypothetical protein BB559_000524 [Furculomyces boomerangus]|uniref:Cyclin-like domain-containing protein n=2 Tax=Harpellales TaxID=61421 RepID=A0A2T9Z4W3_9FUNG|nr:hypothetical protein BB559_000524 [Furculomyces boomerangus]PVZ98614.1 hypothetical protein BB558_005376 [Smittium angustum]
MHSNYHSSSQHNKFLVSSDELEFLASKRQFRIPKSRQIELNIHFFNVLQRIGKNLHLREEVICTCMIYFQRFYKRNDYSILNPHLMLCTCLYLACKVEEMPHHLNTIINESTKVLEDLPVPLKFNCTRQDLVDCEVILLEELEFYLIISHPYKQLVKFGQELGLEGNTIQLAWYITNDTYFTDIPLMYTPEAIALAVTFLVAQLERDDGNEGILGLIDRTEIDMQDVNNITKEILNAICTRSNFNEKKTINYLKQII